LDELNRGEKNLEGVIIMKKPNQQVSSSKNATAPTSSSARESGDINT